MNTKKIISIIVSVALLIAAINYIGISKIIDAFWSISIKHWVLALVATQVTYILMAIRWYYIYGGSHKFQILCYLSSLYFNFFTPSSLGSDGYRLVVLKRKGDSFHKIVMALVQERFLGLYGSIFLLLITSLLVRSDIFLDAESYLVLNAISIASCSAILSMGIFVRWIHPPLWLKQPSHNWLLVLHKHYQKLFATAKSSKNVMAFSFNVKLQFYTLAALIMWSLAVYSIGTGIDKTISFLPILYASLLTELSRLLPISLQGIGVREVVFAYILVGFGYPAEGMFALAAISYLMLGLMQCLNGSTAFMLKFEL